MHNVDRILDVDIADQLRAEGDHVHSFGYSYIANMPTTKV